MTVLPVDHMVVTKLLSIAVAYRIDGRARPFRLGLAVLERCVTAPRACLGPAPYQAF